MGNILCDRVKAVETRPFPHTAVTFLVKYTPGTNVRKKEKLQRSIAC